MADGSGRKPDEELYTWISTIPFSKPTKNLNRDFSDAVMMAEVLKVYYPRYVDLHNYVAASSVSTKKENWNLLNRKVLSKIDMKLNKDTISQLANGQSGAIENVLLELRSKVSKNVEEQNSQIVSNDGKEKGIVEEGNKNEVDARVTTSNKLPVCSADQLNTVLSKSIFVRARETFLTILQWFVSWIFIWRYFPSITFLLSKLILRKNNNKAAELKKISANEDGREAVSRQICVQLRQELREKDDIICTLNHKLAYLESAMKLQDLRISNLTSQILQQAVESEQLGKTQTNNDSQAKFRNRSQIVREKVKIEE